LGLGKGSRSQTGEAQARGHYDGRCRDTCSIHVTNDTNGACGTTATIEAQVANSPSTNLVTLTLMSFALPNLFEGFGIGLYVLDFRRHGPGLRA
jgi:hypothetical protein